MYIRSCAGNSSERMVPLLRAPKTIMAERNSENNLNLLYRAILALETVEECDRFFYDLCTDTELESISQRIVVAKMLTEGKVYSDIVKDTGASTATISRVNRSLKKGKNGYEKVFKKLDEEDK